MIKGRKFRMTRRSSHQGWWITLVVVAACLEFGGCSAPKFRGQMRDRMGTADAWLAGSPYERLYRAGDDQVVDGVIVNVMTFVPSPGAVEGLQLVLATSDGEVTVHAGPRLFAQNHGIRFSYRDQVHVVGCLVEFRGQTVLLAREIARGEDVLTLRDQLGDPLWEEADLSEG